MEEVKKKTDNNDYAVDNNYYNTYLKDLMHQLKDSNKDLSYLESPEYSDELFLTVAKNWALKLKGHYFPVNEMEYSHRCLRETLGEKRLIKNRKMSLKAMGQQY